MIHRTRAPGERAQGSDAATGAGPVLRGQCQPLRARVLDAAGRVDDTLRIEL